MTRSDVPGGAAGGGQLPGRPSPILRIDAVTLATADMAVSVAFYTAVGFGVVSGGAGADFTTFAAGDGFLNLQVDRRAPRPLAPWGRVIFFVDDVDALHRRCREAGLEPSTEPVDAPWGERFFHISDPDGHELSFARPIAGLGGPAGPAGPADAAGSAGPAGRVR